MKLQRFYWRNRKDLSCFSSTTPNDSLNIPQHLWRMVYQVVVLLHVMIIHQFQTLVSSKDLNCIINRLWIHAGNYFIGGMFCFTKKHTGCIHSMYNEAGSDFDPVVYLYITCMWLATSQYLHSHRLADVSQGLYVTDKLHGMLTAYRWVDKSTSIACTLASGRPPCIDCHFAANVKM